MSDIFVAAGIGTDLTSISANLQWTPHTRLWTGGSEDLSWIVSRVDNPSLWAPAFDQQSGIRALLGGRVLPEETDWKRSETLPFSGGLACRYIIDRWLHGGAPAIEELNGAAQIILIDEKNKRLHMWTDRMGFFPAFGWESPGFLLCSHPDIAAAALSAAGFARDFDPVTMAEFLRTGTSTHPHTYWHGINHLDAATYFCFDFGSNPRLREKSVYWRPPCLEGKEYLHERDEIVERLALALHSSVQRRTLPRLGNVAVLLSAGADSRIALFGACNPSRITCYSIYDEANPELEGARRLARIASASHQEFQRSREYYFEQAANAVKLSGGMWSIDSAHFGGLAPMIVNAGNDVVLTGCYADYLLKGLAYNRRHLTFLGRNLPLYRFAPYSHEWYQPFSELTTEWSLLVGTRLDRQFSCLGADNIARSKAEHLRLSPMMREADVSGRLILRRTCGHDFITADNSILSLAFQIAPTELLNGIAFGKAVERVTGPHATTVPNNNYRARVGASELERVSYFILDSLIRKLRRTSGLQPFERNRQSVATFGSWPHWPHVIKLSGYARDWWATLSGDQSEFLFDMLGHERRGWSIDTWADHDPTLFLRVYTASLWLSQNPRALSRAAVHDDHGTHSLTN